MRPARSLVALVAATAGALVLGATPTSAAPAGDAPAHGRGAPGTWTRISTGEVSNIAEPGLYRTADGVLHVFYSRRNGSAEDIAFTNVSSTGKVVQAGSAITGWASVPSDPKAIPGPGGGIRLVFGGLQDTDVSNPYSSGAMYSATSDAAGTAWTLQPGALTQSGYAYGGYGTGATTLADGLTPVVSFPLNSALTWNAGGADSTSTFDECCLYYSTLAREGDAVWAAFYANGSADASQGVFVKQLLPTPGAPIKAPQSTTGGDSVSLGQATPFLARPGGGLFAAYCVGYPTCTRLGLWQVGASAPLSVPGSRGAQEYAIGAGPGGRIWVAWSVGDSNLVRVTHTGTTGLHFGAVTTIKPPHGATIYGLALAASDGSADVVVNDGSALFHQQVLPGLSLEASVTKWSKAKRKRITFTVSDAGAAVKHATITLAGTSCSTKASGRCSITMPAARKKHRFWATARLAGYASAKVRLIRR